MYHTPKGYLTQEDAMSDTLTLPVTGMTCGHCVAAVSKALAAVPGIADRTVSIGNVALTLEPDADAASVRSQAEEAIRAEGYEIGEPGAPIGLSRAKH